MSNHDPRALQTTAQTWMIDRGERRARHVPGPADAETLAHADHTGK